jgi:hypothetical protein
LRGGAAGGEAVKRRRFKDVERPKGASVVPFLPGEGWKHRHRRRLLTNLSLAEQAQVFCDAHKISLNITNNGHHWQFHVPGLCRAEWWPSTAKLVFEADYRHGIHVHDWPHVMRLVTERFGLKVEPKTNNPKEAS